MKRLWKFLAHYPTLWLMAGVYVVYAVRSYTTLDPDFGWHLRSGQYFLQHGIPTHDIFTYTAESFHWVNHEWLSDCLVALIYGLGGYELLALLFGALWTAVIAVMGRGVHWALVASAAVAILPFAGIRALTWSAVALALLALALRQRNRYWRLLLPLLFLVWANIHGSFLIGIAYGGWHVIREKSWRLAVIGLVSLGATLINPYGIEVYTEICRTIFDSNLHQNISEWARFALPISSVPYVLVWVGLTVYYGQRAWRRYVQFETLLFGMSVMSLRMTPLFVLLSLQGLQQTIQSIDASLPKKDRPSRLKIANTAAIALVLVSMGLFAVGHILYKGGVVYPNQTVYYLQEHPCDGNIFNSYNYGGLLIWQLPGTKVYIDGRMPSWQHANGTYMKDYNTIMVDKSFRDQQFAVHAIRCVLIERDSSLANTLSKEGWQITHEDDAAKLLVAPTD